MSKKPKRILAVASGGGHWVQLCRLIPAWDGCAVTYVTTVPGYREAVTALASERGQAKPGFHVVQEANRNQKLRLVKTLLQITLIVLREWPDVIITTGAAPGGFALSIGKLLRRRTVWVDSIANSEELSASGKRAKPFSSLWLTQWEHLAKPEGPEYRGSVL
jgi:UDP-N-acetylglucosamine:LPS N-acetylglucosamine transferase